MPGISKREEKGKFMPFPLLTKGKQISFERTLMSFELLQNLTVILSQRNRLTFNAPMTINKAQRVRRKITEKSA
jgi:hypothetical protein